MIKVTLSLLSLLLLSSLSLAQKTPNYLLSSTPLLEIGSSVTGELSLEDGQNFKDGSFLDLVKIQLNAGDVVELSVSSEFFDTYLTIYYADGTIVGTNDDGAESSDSRHVLSADQTGRYLLVVSGFSEFDLGAYSVSARALEVVDDGVISASTKLSAILDSNDEDLGGRFQDAFTFELEEAKTLSVTMASDVIDSYLIILKDSSVIGENDDNEYSLNATLELELEAGSYTIWATSANTDEFGYYTLEIDGLE